MSAASVGSTISAVCEVHHSPARVYAFLARLDNHWHLGGRALRLSTLDANGRGGRILLGTALGLRRSARTAVTTALEPHRLCGVAHVGRNTRAHVQRSIEPTPHGARVALESTICSVGLVDRALLALGGRWWLRRAFRRTLDALAGALDRRYNPNVPASIEHNRTWTPQRRLIVATAAAGASARGNLSAVASARAAAHR
jgi:hypothetical protein